MRRVREYAEPPAAPTASGPTRRGVRGEWRAGLQVGRLAAATPMLLRAPRGDGAPVVLVPGWRAPVVSIAPLRSFLRHLGHDAHDWDVGVNEGRLQRDVPRLAAQVARLAATVGRPVTLIGWSLGGTLARETARQAPATIAQVITFGSPVVGGPTYTIGARSYGPITVPIIAIFTRRDDIVPWPDCIDRTSPQVRHVEVFSTHMGLGFDPDVWRTIADRLAPTAS